MVQSVKSTHAPTSDCEAGSSPVSAGCNRVIWCFISLIIMSLHTKEHDEILLDMSPEEKRARTSSRAMKERWIVVEEYKYWILSKNEFPYVWYTDNIVIRYKKHHSNRPHWLARAEKWEIQKKREEKWYRVLRNCKKDRSIERYHEHFLLK